MTLGLRHEHDPKRGDDRIGPKCPRLPDGLHHRQKRQVYKGDCRQHENRQPEANDFGSRGFGNKTAIGIAGSDRAKQVGGVLGELELRLELGRDLVDHR
jgi:hypothetical protein